MGSSETDKSTKEKLKTHASLQEQSLSINTGAVNPDCSQFQDEQKLKRQRRKYSNRDSARRSRLWKRAEFDEVSQQAEVLKDENIALRSELNLIRTQYEHLLSENSSLKFLSRGAQAGYDAGTSMIWNIAKWCFRTAIHEVHPDADVKEIAWRAENLFLSDYEFSPDHLLRDSSLPRPNGESGMSTIPSSEQPSFSTETRSDGEPANDSPLRFRRRREGDDALHETVL